MVNTVRPDNLNISHYHYLFCQLLYMIKIIEMTNIDVAFQKAP